MLRETRLEFKWPASNLFIEIDLETIFQKAGSSLGPSPKAQAKRWVCPPKARA